MSPNNALVKEGGYPTSRYSKEASAAPSPPFRKDRLVPT